MPRPAPPASPESEKRLAGRIALITGASRGIGAAVARRFADEGAKLILLARTKAGLEEIDDEIRAASGDDAAPTLVELDLAQPDHIDAMAASIAERFGRLDILVGNAGLLGTMTPMHQIEPAEWDQVVAVNLTANWRLIRAFDPALRAAPAGRAIFVSSGAAQGARPYWGSYAVSKAALEMMVKSWAAETKNTNVRINLFDPGATRTGMRAAAFPGEDPMTLPTPDDLAEYFVDLAETACERHGELVRPR
jgi:NAD(P)-dependent dehydrogenase (short-subunit alcohol dehydrogenase family)